MGKIAARAPHSHARRGIPLRTYPNPLLLDLRLLAPSLHFSNRRHKPARDAFGPLLSFLSQQPARHRDHVYIDGKDGPAAGIHIDLCATTALVWKLAHITHCSGVEYAARAAHHEARDSCDQLRRRWLR